MLERWYFTHDGRRQGPVTSDDLDRLIADRKLVATDLLWREGADTSTAVEAGTVLIALAQTTGYVPGEKPPLPPPAAAPEWLAPSAPLPPEPALAPAGSIPDWLSDFSPPKQPALSSAPSPNAEPPLELIVPPADPGESAAAPGHPCPDWLEDLRKAETPAKSKEQEHGT